MSALVSCLCVTEGRPAFMPWLLWGFERQTYPNKELIVIDSSPIPWSIDRANVRVLAAPPGSNVPTKRNHALDAARGEFLAWFDDDDWQHPERLERLVSSARANEREQSPIVGSCRSWFIDVFGKAARPYDGRGSLIFNTALFRTELAREVRFNEACVRASDTPWLRALRQRHGQRELKLAEDCLALWLCHDQNISNPRRKRQFSTPLAELEQHIGARAWADSTERLALLRQALPAAEVAPRPAPTERSTHARSARTPWSTRHAAPEAFDEPESAAALPTPDPDVTAPATPNAEISALVLLGTNDSAIRGKLLTHWQQRLKLDRTQFHFVLAMPAGEREDEVTPLKAALSRTHGEFLLVLRPQVLFCGSADAWLLEGQRRLHRTRELTFVTAHPGKPQGPLGTTRSMHANAHLAWNRERRAFRWQHPPQAYFLTRREALVGLLDKAPCGPLSSALDAAFTANAYSGLALPTLGSYSIEFDAELTPNDLGWIERVETERLPKSVASRAFIDGNAGRPPHTVRQATRAPIMTV